MKNVKSNSIEKGNEEVKLTSICCANKEKMVKQFRELQYFTQIVNNSFYFKFNFSDIISY